ncbi:hypothetical protein GCM10011494_40190 [Novosphingobium endophyticum]|uniref:Cation-transporting P-type ATPase C-terminal domain-containing protein n=1 Tax=Novosphingobium endophyticum TaxID=1955250 RepID=A0A916TXG2_9SPHN|nr:cation transporting ATPase C-terminal domain-containing protein [Novosphingobium endophyticum]GGC17283.1 hypothetical protein GCM10011494_40190 [Novosphingobium endophyticum]
MSIAISKCESEPTLSGINIQVTFVYLKPLNDLFHTYPLNATDWALSSAFALVGFFVISLEKWFWRMKRAGKELA